MNERQISSDKPRNFFTRVFNVQWYVLQNCMFVHHMKSVSLNEHLNLCRHLLWYTICYQFNVSIKSSPSAVWLDPEVLSAHYTTKFLILVVAHYQSDEKSLKLLQSLTTWWRPTKFFHNKHPLLAQVKNRASNYLLCRTKRKYLRGFLIRFYINCLTKYHRICSVWNSSPKACDSKVQNDTVVQAWPELLGKNVWVVRSWDRAQSTSSTSFKRSVRNEVM